MNIPEGWPTEEMQEVGNRIAATYGVTCAVPVFKAMLAVAPTPPEPIKHANLFKWCHPGDSQEQRWILMFDDCDQQYNLYESEADAIGAFNKAEGRGWNCHLFTSVPRVAPTPPEVEPIGYVSAGGIKKLRDKYADGQSIFPHRGVIYSEPVYASLADEWADKDQPLPEDAEISASHPLNTDRHDLYQEAQRLVGAKRSKFALIDLVNWLLYKNTADDELRKAAEEAHALLVEIDQQMSLTESACEVMDDLRAALNKGKS